MYRIYKFLRLVLLHCIISLCYLSLTSHGFLILQIYKTMLMECLRLNAYQRPRRSKLRRINLLYCFRHSLFTSKSRNNPIFPHIFSEQWHLRQDRRKRMCHFRLGYKKKKHSTYIPEEINQECHRSHVYDTRLGLGYKQNCISDNRYIS